MGIAPKGSNPELYFKFNKNGEKYRMYKHQFFEKNPQAMKEMGKIIDNNPNNWHKKNK